MKENKDAGGKNPKKNEHQTRIKKSSMRIESIVRMIRWNEEANDNNKIYSKQSKVKTNIYLNQEIQKASYGLISWFMYFKKDLVEW